MTRHVAHFYSKFSPIVEAWQCPELSVDGKVNPLNSSSLPEWLNNAVKQKLVYLSGHYYQDCLVIMQSDNSQGNDTTEGGDWLLPDKHGIIRVIEDSILKYFYESRGDIIRQKVMQRKFGSLWPDVNRLCRLCGKRSVDHFPDTKCPK